QLMHTAQGSPLECMIALAVTTGMRKGELLGLQWSDINWDQQTLQVKRTVTYLQEDGSKARFIETEPKTASSKRTIILPPFVIDLLRSHRARQSQVRWKIGSSWRNQDLVFTNSRGGHYYIGVLHQQYEKLLDVAGLPRMRFHDLRHSAATILLSLGVNIKVIQELLGHSNIQITLNTYGHVIPGMQKQAMHSLDMLYKQAQEPPRQLDVKLATF
ncbi:MAG: site-specific integrase, partial [Ktedonobacteraceae bacterium]|nr:site-specific integrase [Ktedonobacteraceae bacterium]